MAFWAQEILRKMFRFRVEYLMVFACAISKESNGSYYSLQVIRFM